MAEHWVTIRLDEITADLAGAPRREGLVTKRCKLCKNAVPATDENTASEQLLIHMQRDHLALDEGSGRPGVRLRRRLTEQGWTPPAEPADDPRETPARPDPAPSGPQPPAPG